MPNMPKPTLAAKIQFLTDLLHPVDPETGEPLPPLISLTEEQIQELLDGEDGEDA